MSTPSINPNILRPQKLADFTGQSKIIANLKIVTSAAKSRSSPLRHVLFQGPPGLGKTTLASILAHEMNVPIKVTSGPVLEKPHMIVGLLSNLTPNSIVFIDEIHRIPRAVEEYLYSAMEDFVLDIPIETEGGAKSVRFKVPPFTLVGATTLSGLLSSPMLSRFGLNLQLAPYTLAELQQVAGRNAKLLSLDITPDALEKLAKCCRGTPRILNNILQFVGDLALSKKLVQITPSDVNEALELLDLHPSGLNKSDIKFLYTLKHTFGGGPSGLKSIALSMGEEETTLASSHEPFLLQEGFIKRTPQGRVLTDKGESFLTKL
jgi:holliday junction DNA helicase RuvB